MKNFYKGGRGLCFCQSVQEAEPRSYKPDHHTKQNTIINSLWPTAYSLLLIFVSMFSLSDALAQSAEMQAAERQNEIKPLQVGDSIPDEVWNLPLQVVNHPDGKESIMLADYRDKKLIILDFWATWCTPCVAMIPKTEKLQHHFDSRIKMILLSDQGSSVISDFLKRLGHNQHMQTTPWSIYGKNILHTVFRYKTIPHYIVIAEGVYKGAVEPHVLNEQYIQLMLDGQWTTIPFKADEVEKAEVYNKEQMLYIGGNGGKGSFVSYLSIFGGYNPTLGNGSSQYEGPSDKGTRIVLLNNSIPWFYKIAFGEGSDRFYNSNRVILEVKRKDKLLWSAQQLSVREWMEAGNVFNYELAVKPELNDVFFEIMREDLRRIFPEYRGEVVKREIPCYVLKIVDIDKLSRNNGEGRDKTMAVEQDILGLRMKNVPLSQFTARLNHMFMQKSPYPIINETEYIDRVNMDILANLSDMEEVNKALDKYGLHFFKEPRMLEVLVISDRKEVESE